MDMVAKSMKARGKHHWNTGGEVFALSPAGRPPFAFHAATELHFHAENMRKTMMAASCKESLS